MRHPEAMQLTFGRLRAWNKLIFRLKSLCYAKSRCVRLIYKSVGLRLLS